MMVKILIGMVSCHTRSGGMGNNAIDFLLHNNIA